MTVNWSSILWYDSGDEWIILSNWIKTHKHTRHEADWRFLFCCTPFSSALSQTCILLPLASTQFINCIFHLWESTHTHTHMITDMIESMKRSHKHIDSSCVRWAMCDGPFGSFVANTIQALREQPKYIEWDGIIIITIIINRRNCILRRAHTQDWLLSFSIIFAEIAHPNRPTTFLFLNNEWQRLKLNSIVHFFCLVFIYWSLSFVFFISCCCCCCSLRCFCAWSRAVEHHWVAMEQCQDRIFRQNNCDCQ